MSQSPKGILFSYAWETQEICPICPRFVAEGRSCQLPPRNFMILLFPGRGGFPGKHIEPTFPIWLKSCLSNSSMVFQPLSNYGPFLRVLSYNNSMICHFAVRCRRHHGGT